MKVNTDLISASRGLLSGYEIRYASLSGGPVSNGKGFTVETEALASIGKSDILLIPGGMGSRKLALDGAFLEALKKAAGEASLVMTVCTGSALAAAAGLLDGLHATGNKKAFDWSMSMGPEVLWQRDARWTKDGKFYTAAGVSAGIDMALGFAADHFGRERALSIAEGMEYCWNEKPAAGRCFKELGK
ncbi:DJ-1/PfpI family protein [uncultured Dialister sp.]|uniref:DJ-1/PfpI family protein n=1 Tax=uncultured Dialister sp. TaxID=278064 RepID=UPI002601A440|nr:DJ-1/PfpI family protein [uncultured Dialister sp.]